MGFSNADTANMTFSVSFNVGESFMWQDTAEATNITFTVTQGTWNATVTMNCTDAGGILVFVASSSGSLLTTSTRSDTKIVENTILVYTPQAFTSGKTYTITWIYSGASTSPTPVPSGGSTLPQVSTGFLWIYLFNGDFLGFFQALFVSAFGFLDLLYGLIVMLFLVPLYIRTKSLLLICIIWILVGGLFTVVMPVVSGLGLLFMALGIGGLLYRIFRGANQ
jgi:hypothetical protein